MEKNFVISYPEAPSKAIGELRLKSQQKQMDYEPTFIEITDPEFEIFVNDVIQDGKKVGQPGYSLSVGFCHLDDSDWDSYVRA